MLRRYFVYSCFRSLFSFRSSLLLLSKNTKRPKIFLLFLFVCFFFFLPWFVFPFCFVWTIRKTQKDFALLCFFFLLVLVFKNRKHEKYLSFFFGFCEFVAGFGSSQWIIGFILLFKPHKWRAIMRINDNLRRGKRLVTNSICFHFCTYTHHCGHA